MKQEFEMTQEEMDKILDINKNASNTVMMVGGVDFSHNLTDAINAYWGILGEKYGFKTQTVEASSKGELFFLAESCPIKVPKTQTEIEMDKYDTLDKIVKQLEWCNYECEGGSLKMNVAFLSLKQMAVAQTKVGGE